MLPPFSGTAGSSETFLLTHFITRRHTPEEYSINIHRRENFSLVCNFAHISRVFKAKCRLINPPEVRK
jgi:hypothetical protein